MEAQKIVAEEEKRAVFLSVCGPATYEIIKAQAAPTAVRQKKYEEIIKLLRDYFVPKTSSIVSRFQFHRREQRSGESISTFIGELRQLAEKCNFEAGTLNDMLRDRLVCGVRDENLQRRLLAEETLTFVSAQSIAIAHEAALAHASLLKEPVLPASQQTSSVNKLSYNTDQRRKLTDER